MSASDPEAEIRFLIGRYGSRATYESLMRILQEEHEFLRGIFQAQSISDLNLTAVVAPAAATAPATAPQDEAPATISSMNSKAKVKIVKHAGVPAAPVAPAPPAPAPMQDEEFPEAPKGISNKEIKQWQKEQEERRREINEQKGIVPENLLTKENMEKWINGDNKGYAYIARNYVGLPETFISAAAKRFGIQSTAAKKRNAIIANKMRKMK